MILPFLETMATQVCNLSCQGCTNYSDLTQQGFVPWYKLKEQLVPWLDRFTIPDFGLMGGEPLINPELRQCLIGLRQLMPTAQLRLTTNGLLLYKNNDIIDLAHSLGNVVFKISIHKETAELTEIIRQILAKYSWETVIEYGITRYKTSNNLRFQINRPTKFIKTYRNTYANMQPHNSSIQDSFSMCIQQNCPLLYQGRIYKCSSQGLLKDTLNKLGNPNLDQWIPYLDDGIGPTDSNEILLEFINNFNQPHKVCAMCPTTQDYDSLLDHTITVKRK